MAKYSYFFEGSESEITNLGKRIVGWEINQFHKLIRQFHQAPQNPLNILEIGPGHGYFARSCLKNDYNYTAIDENPTCVKRLLDQGISANIASVPPINSELKFDVIFMDQVLEHMESPSEAQELIENCYNKLEKGGIVIIACPDIHTHRGNFYDDYTHGYPTSITRISRLLQDFGFDIVYSDYYTFFLKGYFNTHTFHLITKLSKYLGIFNILFGKSAQKKLSSLLPSIVVVGKKNK